MNRHHNLGIAFILLLTTLVVGCGKKQTPRKPSTLITSHGLTVGARQLESKDYSYFFDGSKTIFPGRYSPIHLYLKNDRSTDFVLKGKNLEVELLEKQNLIRLLKRNARGANFLINTSLGGLLLGIGLIPPQIPVFIGFGAGMLIATPIIFLQKYAFEFSLDSKLIEAQSSIAVAPGSEMNRVLCIRKKELTSELRLNVVDEQTNQEHVITIPIEKTK